MYEVKKKRRIIQNLLLSVLLIIIIFFNIIVNIDKYKLVLSNDYMIINSINDMNTSDKYVYVDLKDASLEHYSMNNEKLNINIYTYELDNNNVLVLLKENTIITDKTPFEIIDDNKMTIDIKEKLKDNNYYSKVLSNVDYTLDRKIDLYKIYILFIVILISIISILINFIKLINKK
ncbi:MAG: hypothetical protein IJ105_03290 [Bacilli bacterium]|nr:hypothetical protein [Bacilli bacterium]